MKTIIARSFVAKLSLLCVAGGITGAVLLTPAAVNAAALLRTALTLAAGEDPSLPKCDPVGLETCAVGDARMINGPIVRVTVENMDPARFPAGPACSAEITAGAISVKGIHLVADVAPDGRPVTAVDLKKPGTVKIGDKVHVTVKCQFTDAHGVVQKHETQWGGSF
ncbi:hypothetical protein [Nitrosomonas sp. Nm33]|uniref:hypothetical protein n=1 Tax=Nitrosomonas sp. Nm33 TaxID=133724 RepID=UPI00089D71A5|nr:hypothetical protein [Nitrosomonas sp. Nm33]SDZ14031.1 hypothetical protein SAMN05421755_11312 [Nitrosomonas sp. Nm33]